MKHKEILIGTSRLRSNRAARRPTSWIKMVTKPPRGAALGNLAPEIFAVDRFAYKGSKTISGSMVSQAKDQLSGSTATTSTTRPRVPVRTNWSRFKDRFFEDHLFEGSLRELLEGSTGDVSREAIS